METFFIYKFWQREGCLIPTVWAKRTSSGIASIEP